MSVQNDRDPRKTPIYSDFKSEEDFLQKIDMTRDEAIEAIYSNCNQREYECDNWLGNIPGHHSRQNWIEALPIPVVPSDFIVNAFWTKYWAPVRRHVERLNAVWREIEEGEKPQAKFVIARQVSKTQRLYRWYIGDKLPYEIWDMLNKYNDICWNRRFAFYGCIRYKMDARS